jgi:hypothetical protein
MEIDDIQGILTEFLTTEANVLWIVDPRVHFDGDQEEFYRSFDDCDADLLATAIRTLEEEPAWHFWSSLRIGEDPPPPDSRVAALLSLIRISRQAAEAILAGIGTGWRGHPEALLPTLIKNAGLKIEDIGGWGSFTPAERIGRWYDKRTWHWKGPLEHVPGILHFPVQRQQRALAPARVSAGDAKGIGRILYVSPVGGASKELLPEVLDVFQSADADCLLLQYDEADLPVPDGIRVIRDKGYKWQLALRHLSPDIVQDYDYIFFWDDDLSMTGFDPLHFVRIMQANRLEMAQPAILSSHGLSHNITRPKPCPPPWREPNGDATHSVVGRLTNFVEIMAPVFTRDAWSEFYGYLDPSNRSGWGYDYIPLGRKGIVDIMPVRHTRPVQSINDDSERDLRRFLDDQGLFRHAPVEHGWLFE